jgi:hypothetical protein
LRRPGGGARIEQHEAVVALVDDEPPVDAARRERGVEPAEDQRKAAGRLFVEQIGTAGHLERLLPEHEGDGDAGRRVAIEHERQRHRPLGEHAHPDQRPPQIPALDERPPGLHPVRHDEARAREARLVARRGLPGRHGRDDTRRQRESTDPRERSLSV